MSDFELTEEGREEKKKSQRKEWRARSAEWFGCIIYPSEDDRHKRFMDYIAQRKELFPQYLYIVHYKDIYTEHDVIKWYEKHSSDEPYDFVLGDLKKEHIHFIFRRRSKCPLSTVKKFFACWLSHVEIINDVTFYVNYMLHRDPVSFEYHKPEYQESEFRGDLSIVQESIIQNVNFELLDRIVNRILKCDKECNLLSLRQSLKDEESVLFLSYDRVIRENTYYIRALCQDRQRQIDDAFYDRFAGTLRDADSGDVKSPLYWRGKRVR